jgi:hypothetical protein
MLKKKTPFAAVALVALSTGLAAAQTPAAAPSDAAKAREEIDKAVESMRKDARATKADILGKTLALDTTQAAAFWPVYKQYEAELAEVNNERVGIIQDLVEHQSSLNDAKAQGLIDRQLVNQERRLALTRKYKDEFLKVLPAKTVARFLQIDHRLNVLLDLAAASAIPLVQ